MSSAPANLRPIAREILPDRIKVLHVTSGRAAAGWLASALAADRATQVTVAEEVGGAAALTRLRHEEFEALLIDHEPGGLDALELVEGLRSSGHDQPIVILSRHDDRQLPALACEVGADGYCPLAATTTRGLLWSLARAVERHALQRENRRLREVARQRAERDRDEARLLLAAQRAAVDGLTGEALSKEALSKEALSGVATAESSSGDDGVAADGVARRVPASLVDRYRETLRALVIMGTGNLTEETAALAERLAASGLAPREAWQLHVQVLEELVQGLGSRSGRHLVQRADLLIVQVMAHLAESYRRRAVEHA